MSPVEALALLHTTEREAVGRQRGLLGKAEICVFGAYGLDAEAPEKEWRRHRGTLESVRAVEDSGGLSVRSSWVWRVRQSPWLLTCGIELRRCLGLPVLTLEVPYMLSTGPLDPQPHGSCTQRPRVCTVLCGWYRLAPIGLLSRLRA